MNLILFFVFFFAVEEVAFSWLQEDESEMLNRKLQNEMEHLVDELSMKTQHSN